MQLPFTDTVLLFSPLDIIEHVEREIEMSWFLEIYLHGSFSEGVVTLMSGRAVSQYEFESERVHCTSRHFSLFPILTLYFSKKYSSYINYFDFSLPNHTTKIEVLQI